MTPRSQMGASLLKLVLVRTVQPYLTLFQTDISFVLTFSGEVGASTEAEEQADEEDGWVDASWRCFRSSDELYRR
uniref:Putative secreted protein n=1 Tax=Ixodes ricinus TaxID=34613 RepID=A0A6B0TVG6_IXORI